MISSPGNRPPKRRVLACWSAEFAAPPAQQMILADHGARTWLSRLAGTIAKAAKRPLCTATQSRFHAMQNSDLTVFFRLLRGFPHHYI